jgi:hypothetical protein
MTDKLKLHDYQREAAARMAGRTSLVLDMMPVAPGICKVTAAHKAPTREALQAKCDAFNFECSIGSPVAVNIDGRTKPLITTTRSAAQVLSGHSAVVWLEGVSGCYDLEHVAPITSPGEAWAVLADSGNVIYWSHDRARVSEVAKQHGRPYGEYTPRAAGTPSAPALPIATEQGTTHV